MLQKQRQETATSFLLLSTQHMYVIRAPSSSQCYLCMQLPNAPPGGFSALIQH